MSSSLAPRPPLNAQPATLEGVSSFRVNTAALVRPAGHIAMAARDLVVVTCEDGGVVVYPPSKKLAILEAYRAAKTAKAKPRATA